VTATRLRLAFAGTPELAATILQTILADNTHSIEIVYTRPDRRAGRGRRLMPCPVKLLAEKHKLPLRQAESALEMDADNKLAACDALIVAAYGMILPATILTRPRLGCINVHTSLLPRWRGAAPIQRAIQAGDKQTGITIMQMDAGLDSGDILLQKTCPIYANDTAGILQTRLAGLGGKILLDALHGLANNTLQRQKQDEPQASYAKKITKEEADIDWSQTAGQIEQTVRALIPAPVAHSKLHNMTMRIWAAKSVAMQTTGAPPGTVIECSPAGILVATQKNALLIKQLQLPGKKVISAADFLNGHRDFMENQ